MTREPLSSQEYLCDIVQKYLKPLPLAVLSSCGHTVALTSERVNTVLGRELIFPFSSPEEEPSLSPFSQSQTDVITTGVTDRKRTTERKQARTRSQHYNLIPNKDGASRSEDT